jgi:hypothetical protein
MMIFVFLFFFHFFLNWCPVSKLELNWDEIVGFFNGRAATVFVKYSDVAEKLQNK